MPPIVIWLYGPTGTGKTRLVHEREREVHFWTSTGSLEYFNGYGGETVVLFDDFRASDCKFQNLLRYLDIYRVIVNIKHAYANWVAETIYITCNKHPRDCYNVESERVNQLLRRIHKIIFLNEEGGMVIEKDVQPVVLINRNI